MPNLCGNRVKFCSSQTIYDGAYIQYISRGTRFLFVKIQPVFESRRLPPSGWLWRRLKVVLGVTHSTFSGVS